MLSVWIIVAVIAAIVCLCILKTTYGMERSRTIHVPAEKVFAVIQDLEIWSKLNPWYVHEPEAKWNYSENTSEVGSYYSWTGTLIGAGKLEHTKITPNTYIEQKLTFTKPQRAICFCAWELEDNKNSCKLTWKMQGKTPFLLSFIIPKLKKGLEMDFDFGLDMIAMHLDPNEAQHSFHFKGVHDSPAFHFVYKEYQGKQSGLKAFAEKAFPELEQSMKNASIKPRGNPFALTWNISKDTIHYGASFPIEQVSSTMLPAGYISSTKTIKLILKGSYERLPEAWERLVSQAKMMKLKSNISKGTPALEIYETVSQTNPNENTTALYLPIK